MTTKLAKQRNKVQRFIILLRWSGRRLRSLVMATAVGGGKTVAVA